VMAQEDQAGEHRHRKGVLRFEPPDVERAISALTIAPREE
jgi:hypothetical protein